jgi:hypothetical protein
VPGDPADFVVQHACVTWTKASRGGAGAARRNAVAHGYALGQPAPGGRGVHHVRLDERAGFAAVAEWTPLPGPDRWRDHELRLRVDGDALLVRLEPGAYGMPRRDCRPPAVRLAAGEWLRWQVNARLHGDVSGWWYRHDIYGVARAPYDAGVFLGTPTRDVDELAYLR